MLLKNTELCWMERAGNYIITDKLKDTVQYWSSWSGEC